MGPFAKCEPPLHCQSPGVANRTPAIAIAQAACDVHNDDDNDNTWQRGPLWPHGMGPTTTCNYIKYPFISPLSRTAQLSWYQCKTFICLSVYMIIKHLNLFCSTIVIISFIPNHFVSSLHVASVFLCCKSHCYEMAENINFLHRFTVSTKASCHIYTSHVSLS